MAKHFLIVFLNYWKQNVAPIYIGGKERENWHQKTSSLQKWKAHFLYIASIQVILLVCVISILVVVTLGTKLLDMLSSL